MAFDPERFGAAMRKAVEQQLQPLKDEIKRLTDALAELDEAQRSTVEVQTELAGVQAEVSELRTKSEQLHALPEQVNQLRSDSEQQLQSMKDEIKRLQDARAELEAREPAKGEKGEPGQDGKPGVDGAPGERGADGAPGKDGLSVCAAFQQEDGHLILVQTDGATKDLGRVRGKDGAPGKDGEGLASVDMEYDAEQHQIIMRWVSGGEVKSMRYPAGGIHHRGYWQDDMKCNGGDAVTHDGYLWIAKRATSETPRVKAQDWTIGARKGRDGKDYREAPKPEPVKL